MFISVLLRLLRCFDLVEITNKMQPCIRIYYSAVHWRLNVFRAAYRSSSGALTVFAASGLHTHVVTSHSQVWVGTLRLDSGRSPHVYVNQRLQIQLELLMMSGMPLETCWAFNERWNNKFYYKVTSCWLFLLNHNMMHGSMNIKYDVLVLLPLSPPPPPHKYHILSLLLIDCCYRYWRVNDITEVYLNGRDHMWGLWEGDMNMGSYSNSVRDCRLDSSSWGCGPVLGYCEHSDEY